MNKPTQHTVIWLVIATLGLYMPSLALAQLATDQAAVLALWQAVFDVPAGSATHTIA